MTWQTETIPEGPKVIYVDRPTILRNIQRGEDEPPILVYMDGKKWYAHNVIIPHASVLSSLTQPDEHGNTVMLETRGPVALILKGPDE